VFVLPTIDFIKMAEVDPARIRTIKIKTGVVNRIGKEKIYYEKEAEREKSKAEKMKEDGRDEYEVRKQEEVFAESKMMIPDCIKKLGAAWDDLSSVINCESDLSAAAEYKSAQEALEKWKETANR